MDQSSDASRLLVIQSYGRSAPACRTVKWKTVPPPGLLSVHNLPRCASTIARQTDKPAPPIPFALVVTNGSNNLWRTSSGSNQTGISNADLHHPSRHKIGCHQKLSPCLVLHGLNAIPQQIEKNLLHLNSVDLNMQIVRGSISTSSVRLASLTLERVSATASSITCDRFSARISTSRSSRNRVSVPLSPRSLRLVRDALESGLNPLLISGRDDPTTGIDVVTDRSEGLIDLMNERGHHLTEFIQALNVSEFRL